jgi:hypothetical protein
MKKFRAFFVTIFFFVIFFIGTNLFALNLWRHPEAAEINSIFIDARFASISFTDGFYIPNTEFGIDYLFPCFLPLSLGAYVRMPEPNLKEFGLRAAYHIDLRDKKLDTYFLYVFDLGFLRNDLLVEYKL